jgi:hypothetical protein
METEAERKGMKVSNDNVDMKDKEQSVTRSGRTVKKPAYSEHYVLSAMSYSDDEKEGRSDRKKWRKAIKRRARKQSQPGK